MNVLALTVNKAGYHPRSYHLQLFQSVWHFLTSDHETWDSELTVFLMTELGPLFSGPALSESSSIVSFRLHNQFIIPVLESGKLRHRESRNLHKDI